MLKGVVTSTAKYVKSFSNGQITVPKEFRDMLGLGTDFWLKMFLENQTIVAQPVDNVLDRKQYVQRINQIDSSVFDEKDFKNWKSVRKEFNTRVEKYEW